MGDLEKQTLELIFKQLELAHMRRQAITDFAVEPSRYHAVAFGETIGRWPGGASCGPVDAMPGHADHRLVHGPRGTFRLFPSPSVGMRELALFRGGKWELLEIPAEPGPELSPA